MLLLVDEDDELVGVEVVIVALDVAAAAEEQIGSTFGPGDGVYRKLNDKKRHKVRTK